MLHLSNVRRRSELYKRILLDNDIKKYAAKYQFRGHLGEQDFFVLLDAEHRELFYVVPCQWNRQLCRRFDRTQRTTLMSITIVLSLITRTTKTVRI